MIRLTTCNVFSILQYNLSFYNMNFNTICRNTWMQSCKIIAGFGGLTAGFLLAKSIIILYNIRNDKFNTIHELPRCEHDQYVIKDLAKFD